MSNQNFEDLGITTMTVVMQLEGTVDLNNIYPLLEISHVDIIQPSRATAKVKMPFLDRPGSIISARYKGMTRGVVKSNSKGFFRNSITIDMSARTKNVNLKISRNKIQMCGASSVEMARDSGSLILENLIKVDDDLSYLREHPNETEEVIQWIRNSVKGELCVIPSSNEEGEGPTITNKIQLPEVYPRDLDERILFFLLRRAREYDYYSDYLQNLEEIRAMGPVITRPLDIINVKKVMVNYNYYLGCKIDRRVLSELIHKRNGFISRYDNTVDYSVTIRLPYEIESPHRSDVHRRNSKNSYHIFIVYRSGKVTQTGPSEELMRDAYILFNQTVEELKPFISKGDPEPTPLKESEELTPDSNKVKISQRIRYRPTV